jgi:O-antigen/teichoic acid export membrane protein
LKLFKRHIDKIIADTVGIITSRQRLKQITSTPLYRNALFLISNSVTNSGLGFFFWMVVARLYSETEVGYGSAAISASNLLALLSMAGLNFSLIRFMSQADEPRRFINSSFTLCGLLSLVVATVFISTVDFWSPALSFVKQNAIFYLTFLFLIVLTTLSNLMDSVFVAKRSAGFVLSKNVIFILLRIPVVVALVIFFHTFGVVASWAISLGISLVISTFLFLPRVEDGYKPAPTLSLSPFKNMWQYSASSYLASLLGRAPILILPLMVLNLLGTESNAYFYIAWMISSLLFTIPGSVSRSLFAEGSHSEEKIKEDVAKSIKFTFLLLVPTAIVLIAAAKWILLLFGPGYSTNALLLLWLLILASLPRGINNVYIGLLRVQDRLKELLVIRGFIAISVLVPSFFLMTVYGMIAIGYVWLGVHTVVSIVLIFRLSSRVMWFSRTKGGDW